MSTSLTATSLAAVDVMADEPTRLSTVALIGSTPASRQGAAGNAHNVITSGKKQQKKKKKKVAWLLVSSGRARIL